MTSPAKADDAAGGGEGAGKVANATQKTTISGGSGKRLAPNCGQQPSRNSGSCSNATDPSGGDDQGGGGRGGSQQQQQQGGGSRPRGGPPRGGRGGRRGGRGGGQQQGQGKDQGQNRNSRQGRQSRGQGHQLRHSESPASESSNAPSDGGSGGGGGGGGGGSRRRGGRNRKSPNKQQQQQQQQQQQSGGKKDDQHEGGDQQSWQQQQHHHPRQPQCAHGGRRRARPQDQHQRNRGHDRNLPPPAAMTVIVHRVDLHDGWSATGNLQDQQHYDPPHLHFHQKRVAVDPYHFRDPNTGTGAEADAGAVHATEEVFEGDVYADAVEVEDAAAAAGTGGPPAAAGEGVDGAKEEKKPASKRGVGDDFFDSFCTAPSAPPSGAPHRSSSSASEREKDDPASSVVVVHAPPSKVKARRSSAMENLSSDINARDNPHPPDVVHDKYWAQRRRLFSRFDEGIELDAEGWYSVTPEAIADHVARRVGDMASTMVESGANGMDGIVILDAFCGCGGNAIAFGKLSPFYVSLVVCVDIDIGKLRMAAHNAALYGIPTDKLLFVRANTLHVMDRCYRNGDLVSSSGSSLPPSPGPPVETEECSGFTIGGIELLPPHIHAVFIDPPWGGVDYGSAGKEGYDLAKHMKIRYDVRRSAEGTFDEEGGDAGEQFVDGVDLLKMAAATTRSKVVVYDMPRNTNRMSLGRAALSAGFRGNVKLEEYYLNGRLKTITSYMGEDYSDLVRPKGAKKKK